VVILGGGVIGLMTAYFLGKDGASVVVLDKGELGQEASWAGAGILPPGDSAQAKSPFDQLRSLSVGLYPGLAAELFERTGIDTGYRRCGGIEFLESAGDATHDEWHGEGIRTERLTAAAAHQLEPALGQGLGEALLLPDLAQVRNPRLLQSLITACQSLKNIELQPGVSAYGLLKDGNRIDAVHTSRGLTEANKYLIATGAWTDGLLRPLGWSLPIEPVRGQIALLNPGMTLLSRVLMWGSQYMVPRVEGRILVGSTEEYAGFDKRPTATGIHGLLELAIRLVPDLAAATIEKTWAGLRPGSRDGLPYLGRIGEFDNLFVAAGHFRAGLQLAPGTAVVMKELLLDRPTTIPLDAFDPARHARRI
jgi:glycine oxidase